MVKMSFDGHVLKIYDVLYVASRVLETYQSWPLPPLGTGFPEYPRKWPTWSKLVKMLCDDHILKNHGVWYFASHVLETYQSWPLSPGEPGYRGMSRSGQCCPGGNQSDQKPFIWLSRPLSCKIMKFEKPQVMFRIFQKVATFLGYPVPGTSEIGS